MYNKKITNPLSFEAAGNQIFVWGGKEIYIEGYKKNSRHTDKKKWEDKNTAGFNQKFHIGSLDKMTSFFYFLRVQYK